MAKSFDRGTHQPFRVDHKGLNKEVNLKDYTKATNAAASGPEDVKIPLSWTRGPKTNPNRTLTDMQANRRRGLQADISFDLDGDGIVGNRDLVLSKLFDKDGDGKLNA